MKKMQMIGLLVEKLIDTSVSVGCNYTGLFFQNSNRNIAEPNWISSRRNFYFSHISAAISF